MHACSPAAELRYFSEGIALIIYSRRVFFALPFKFKIQNTLRR